MRFTLSPHKARSLAPAWSEIWALAALFAGYFLAYELFDESGITVANHVGPGIFSGILGLGLWRLLQADPRNIWTALFWFRLSSGVYFGVGTLSVYFMNPATRLYIEGFYQFSAADVFKLNLIVTLATIVVLLSAKAVIAMRRGFLEQSDGCAHLQGGSATSGLLTVGVAFLCAGLGVQYGVNLPYQLGWIEIGSLPGSFLQLSNFSLIGMFLITLWSLERARWVLPFLVALLVVEMAVQVLLFAKSGVLRVLIMFLMAFLWRSASPVRLVAVAILVVPLYASLQPLISYGRAEVMLRFGEDGRPGLSERLPILTAYFEGGGAVADSEHQGALARISYVNAATFVIREYDVGRPARWPELLPAVFVPRFLWPDKPIITDVARDITEMAQGFRTSSTGVGLFADSYWAMGWFGVVVFMMVYGGLIGGLTVMAVGILRRGRWILFPLVLMAQVMGFRTDGLFISDVAGHAVIMLGMFVLLLFVERVWSTIMEAPSGARGVRLTRYDTRRG
jgi:hypothetical protein